MKREPQTTFSFTTENKGRVARILSRYPEGKQASAVLPLLDLAQRQSGNWLPRAAMDHVAELLSMPPMRVYEVASFYTMFNLEPVGRHVIQLCRTTSCWLMGGDAIAKALEEKLGIGVGQTTSDGRFTLKETECLGACTGGPVIQIDDDVFEALTPESVCHLIDEIRAGHKPSPGPVKKTCCGKCKDGGKV